MLTLDRLNEAVRKDAAIRRVRRLQPVGGAGDKLFPPTYPGDRNNDPPRHVFEHRRIAGRNELCVLIDSVQSQANRLEEALKHGREAKKLWFPTVAVDFSGTTVADVGLITALDAPHRVFDAILRDSEIGGKKFKDSEEGRRLIQAKSQNARALFELAPTALLFGAWNSTGEGGGLGAKFPRCVVSEIIGIGVATDPGPTPDAVHPSGKRPGSRIDPLGIRSGIKVYKAPDGEWSLEAPKGSKAKEVRPSEVNHSNIRPSVDQLGVSVDYAHHCFVLSFAALRRLRFEGKAGVLSDADVAAQTALAALGLAAAVLQDEVGYFLRSRCDLVPDPTTENTTDAESGRFQIVRSSGVLEEVNLDSDAATALALAAADAAGRLGLGWRKEDVLLRPQGKLVDLVRLSREQALKGVAEESPAAEG